ncbi:MAG TPA: ferredoxin reductase, partial [Burkholderiaceae bacterium]|nr:ferredoxin reductase [Burkholderiaceae bacterium]
MSTTTTLRLRVMRKTAEAEGICSFELADPAGAALPAFTAGAHLDVQVPGGPTRQYSLCNNPAETQRYLIAVLREASSRGGSAGMHERLSQGDLLDVSPPKNHFPLAEGAASHLLLAGGIGVTPILAMAERLHATGADFAMHYCSRTRARTAFADRLARAPFAARVHLHLDDGDASQRLDLAALLQVPVPGRHLYVCGPQGFMDAVLGTARKQGWPESQLHYEFFSAAPVDTAGDRGFEVQLARS